MSLEEKVERLEDALDHIMRVTRQANHMTNRLKWIDLRAKSALENTEEWRQYDYPRNRHAARENLRRRYRELKAGVERLASMEALTISRAVDKEADAELLARIEFAEKLL